MELCRRPHRRHGAGGRSAASLTGRGRRSPANLDHVVIAPSGVLVIDTKAHAGPVELIDRGSFCRPSLFRSAL
ncbi:MAG: nuclease-related domain-containing protein [Acidimicrobiales bacterium]